MPRPVEMSDETQETFALLLFTLVRGGSVHGGDAAAAGAPDAADQYRSSLRSELDGIWPFRGLAAYDVIPGANARWAGGGIDVVVYRELGDLEAAMSVVVASRDALAADHGFSCRAFLARERPVRTPPWAGVHGFSSGRAPAGFDRRQWQQRWRAHTSVLAAAPAFAEHLRGYSQFHGLDASTAARLGADDIDGIAHMTYASLEDRTAALQSAEYLEIVRPDEDQFVARDHGVSVLVSRRPP
jgi:EthD domain